MIGKFKLKITGIIFLLFFLLGAGCDKNIKDLNLEKMKLALAEVGGKLEWSAEVVERVPSEYNYYGNSFIVYGPFKQETGDVVNSDSLEIIEFESNEYAIRAYGQEECFKGKGEPIKIYDTEGCCLNNSKNESNQVIMQKENYIFRVNDYFHANCQAVGYLKQFWSEYLKK